MAHEPRAAGPRLWLIVDRSVDDQRLHWVMAQLEPTLAAAEGRVGVIERDHTTSSDTVRMTRLSWLKASLRAVAVPLWVNRRVDLALAIDADGVQLTSRSPSTALIRRIYPDLSLARSCHTFTEAATACGEGADFILLSPIFDPMTKAPERAPHGLGGLEAIASRVNRPVIALGGMSPDRMAGVLGAGAAGIATIGGVFGVADPGAAVGAYLAHLHKERLVGPT